MKLPPAVLTRREGGVDAIVGEEPIVNTSVESLADLDAIIAARCVRPTNDEQRIKGPSGFHG